MECAIKLSYVQTVSHTIFIKQWHVNENHLLLTSECHNLHSTTFNTLNTALNDGHGNVCSTKVQTYRTTEIGFHVSSHAKIKVMASHAQNHSVQMKIPNKTTLQSGKHYFTFIFQNFSGRLIQVMIGAYMTLLIALTLNTHQLWKNTNQLWNLLHMCKFVITLFSQNC